MAFKDSSKGAKFTVITFDIGQIELHSYRSTTKEPWLYVVAIISLLTQIAL